MWCSERVECDITKLDCMTAAFISWWISDLWSLFVVVCSVEVTKDEVAITAMTAECRF